MTLCWTIPDDNDIVFTVSPAFPTAEDEAKLQLADMASRGRIGRRPPLPIRPWIPSYLALEDQALVYGRFSQRNAEETVGALDTFVRIRSAAGVLRFARKYGVLEFCEHDRPCTHAPIKEEINGKWGYTTGDCLPLRAAEGVACRSPVDLWLTYANEAAALLRVGATLRSGKVPPKDYWAGVRYSEFLPPFGVNLDNHWHELMMYVNDWLGDVEMQFALDYSTGIREVSLRLEATTFGLLGFQLAAAITRVKEIAVCMGCSEPYFPSRKPQAGRENFCEECRVTVGPRRRKQRSVEKEKEQSNGKASKRRR